MNIQRNRIETIITLLMSCSSISQNSKTRIRAEFHKALDVNRVEPTLRRNILKIFHSSRALESSLKAFLDHHGVRGNAHSIGQYIDALQLRVITGHTNITQAERYNYKRSIANVRNAYFHNADTFPHNENEVTTLISEMHALISRVMTL